jgi:hypothetical protein
MLKTYSTSASKWKFDVQCNIRNYATIQNRGFELEFDANILPSTSELNGMFFGNWSTNRNKITKLDGTSSLFLDGFAGSSSRAHY